MNSFAIYILCCLWNFCHRFRVHRKRLNHLLNVSLNCFPDFFADTFQIINRTLRKTASNVKSPNFSYTLCNITYAFQTVNNDYWLLIQTLVNTVFCSFYVIFKSLKPTINVFTNLDTVNHNWSSQIDNALCHGLCFLFGGKVNNDFRFMTFLEKKRFPKPKNDGIPPPTVNHLSFLAQESNDRSMICRLHWCNLSKRHFYGRQIGQIGLASEALCVEKPGDYNAHLFKPLCLKTFV